MYSDITSDAGDLTMTDRTEDTDVDKEVQLVTGGSTSPVPSLAVTEGDFGIDSKMDSERSTLQRYIIAIVVHSLCASVIHCAYERGYRPNHWPSTCSWFCFIVQMSST